MPVSIDKTPSEWPECCTYIREMTKKELKQVYVLVYFIILSACYIAVKDIPWDNSYPSNVYQLHN